MKCLAFALTFHGEAAQVSDDPVKLRAVTNAVSCRHTTEIGSDGVTSAHEAVVGGDASFESEVTVTTPGEFFESGVLDYGHGNRIHFSTIEIGTSQPGPEEGARHGSVRWKIDRGEGQFEGAMGHITSNFMINAEGRLTDRQFVVAFIP